MPDLTTVKNQFESRLAELIAETKQIDAELREPDSADFAERATESEEDEVLEGLGKAALDEIGKIRSALKRIESGTYGVCTACGEPINEARLEAIPYAANCIKCVSG